MLKNQACSSSNFFSEKALGLSSDNDGTPVPPEGSVVTPGKPGAPSVPVPNGTGSGSVPEPPNGAGSAIAPEPPGGAENWARARGTTLIQPAITAAPTQFRMMSAPQAPLDSFATALVTPLIH